MTMVIAPLRKALTIIKELPAVWLLGIVTGIMGGMMLLIQVYVGGFYAERFGIIQLIILPFFIGGSLYIIKSRGSSLREFLEGGYQYYWKLLLTSVVILFLAFISMLIIVLFLSIFGLIPDLMLLQIILIGIMVPFAFFTFFYDVAIVFEEKKVLDSIRRSIEFVFNRSLQVFLFFIVNILILGAISFIAIIIWAALITGHYENVLDVNTTLGQQITPQDILSSLGIYGIVVTTIVYIVALTIIVTILYVYKACFFRHYLATPTLTVGEYDEKGRWYKY